MMTARSADMPAPADIAREIARLRSSGEGGAAALIEVLHRELNARLDVGVPCPVCDGTGSFDWQAESAGSPAFPCGH
jgi:hypothetical protein